MIIKLSLESLFDTRKEVPSNYLVIFLDLIVIKKTVIFCDARELKSYLSVNTTYLQCI